MLQNRILVAVQAALLVLILIASLNIAVGPLRLEGIRWHTLLNFSFHIILLPLLIIYLPLSKLKQANVSTTEVYLKGLSYGLAAGLLSAVYTHTISYPGSFLFQIHSNEVLTDVGQNSVEFGISLSTNFAGYTKNTGLPMFFAEVFLFSLFYWLYVLLYLQAFALLRKRKLKKQLKQQQLDILRYQLNPHFLFNSLNSIRGMLYEDVNEARFLLAEFRSLFQHHFENKSHLIDVSEEVALCNHYLKLEQVRFEERMQLKWQIDEVCEGAKLPSMSLFTLIENAVKHGIAQLIYGGCVEVSINKRGRELVISVINPINPNAQADGTKTGLSNLDNRLTLLYENDFTLSCEKGAEQFKVELTVPFKIEAKA